MQQAHQTEGQTISGRFVKSLLCLAVVKPQVSTVFSVDLTNYGWSVKDGDRHLGLFVTQQHALADVKRRRAELRARGRSSTVVVTGLEQGGIARYYKPYR
jgi:hypothetical protein